MARPLPAPAERAPSPRAARLQVATRTLAATLGNYVVSALATAWLARLLACAIDPAEASVLATLFSFALFATLVLVVFATHALARLCLMLGALAAGLGALLWLDLPGAGGLA